MQTGIFYVRLRDDLKSDEQGKALEGRVRRLRQVFTAGKPYPVLAVEYRGKNKKKQTFYHIPMDNNEMGWFASDYFLFARD